MLFRMKLPQNGLHNTGAEIGLRTMSSINTVPQCNKIHLMQEQNNVTFKLKSKYAK